MDLVVALKIHNKYPKKVLGYFFIVTCRIIQIESMYVHVDFGNGKRYKFC